MFYHEEPGMKHHGAKEWCPNCSIGQIYNHVCQNPRCKSEFTGMVDAKKQKKRGQGVYRDLIGITVKNRFSKKK